MKSIRHYLSYQIFASFWLTFAILLCVALILPNFDAREFSPLETSQRDLLQKESFMVEHKFNLDEVFENKLSLSTDSGFDIVLLERNSGKLSIGEQRYLKSVQAFIYKAEDPKKPLQRRFYDIEIQGPFLVKSNKREYYQYFLQHVDPQKEIINKMFDSPGIMLLVLLVVSTPVIVWLSWNIAKPVKMLRLSANAVAMGNLAINPELETGGINELREVGKSFNQMIASLQELNTYQQRLLSDISHELKTPLARLQLAIAIIRRRNGESNEINRIENEIQKLDTMIHNLLSLSRQQINHHLNREVFPINKIWEDVLEDARFEAEEKGINFFISQRIPFPEHHFINGNPTLLASAVENVIRNAQKYAKNSIKVLIYLDKKDFFIVVDDDGYGVPENQYEQIFRPFYRVDEARDRQTGGTGLGLAIVANAVKQHNGRVVAKQSPSGGLRIKISLPLWV